MRCLNDHLESFYASYAYVLYRHPLIFMICPLIVTCCLSIGFVLMEDRTINETIYLFTPTDGRNRYEKAIILEHWPMNEEEDNFIVGLTVDVRRWFYVIVTSKNKTKGLLNNETLDEIQALNYFIMDNFTISLGDYNYNYRSICLRNRWGACFPNSHVNGLRDENQLVEIGGPPIRYPINREYLSEEVQFLGSLFGDVQVNISQENKLLNVRAIRLAYFNRRHKNEERDYDILSIQWRIELQEYLLQYRSELIHVAFGNEDTINQGLLEGSKVFVPKISITFSLMLIFSFLNSFVILQKRGFLGIDWVRSKPILACFGVTEPGLAIVSTIGLMLLIGLPFHTTIGIMPFLVFAIGINDMFIMISAWHCTKKTDSPEVRFSNMLSDAAVSITITSVSDILAFAVGAWNSLPAIQTLCIYTSVAFFFELIYQCTFYAAAMAIFAKAECEGRHCVILKKTVSLDDAKTKFQRRLLAGTILNKPTPIPITTPQLHPENGTVKAELNKHASMEDDSEMNFIRKIFHNYYVPILLHPITKVAALILFVVYLAMAGWGCAVMDNGLPYERLMWKEHYSLEFLNTYKYWKNGIPIQVVVSNPANLTTQEGREKMFELARAFENTAHSMDSSGTFYWLREYMRSLNESFTPISNTQDQWCYGIRDWLKTDSPGLRIASLKWANDSEDSLDYCKIRAFRFLISTKDFEGYDHVVEAVTTFRDICDRYSAYNVTTLEEFTYPYTDQYLAVNPTMIRNGIIAIFLMIMISMLMIPHPVCGIFITLATVSIDTGVSGFLSWWDVSMDSLTMTNMLLATGFAVDLSAHVSYAYIRSPGTPEEKVRRAIEELGWPVFQGVSSTFLGVLVLGTVNSYLYTTFFKTVFLVIIFGIFHSLVFLPIALAVFAPGQCKCCIKKKNRTKPSNAILENNMTINGGKMNTQQNGHHSDVILSDFGETVRKEELTGDVGSQKEQ